MKTLIALILAMALGAPTLALGTAIIRIRRLNNSQRILLLTPAIGLLFEIIILVFRKMHYPNLPLLHLYTLLSFWLAALYYHSVTPRKTGKTIIALCFVLFTIFSVINSLFIQTLYEYNSYALALQALMIIGFSLGGFYKLLTEMKSHSVVSDPEFWANSAFLVYYSASLFILILSDAIVEMDEQTNYLIWGIRGLFLILFYLSLSVGFLLKK